MGKWNRLSIKISTLVVIMISILTFVSGAILLNSINKTTQETIAKNSVGVAQNIAERFDAAEYEQFLQTKTEDDHYWRLREELNDFREKANVLYAYTLEVTENNEVAILVDGMPIDEEELVAEIGELTEGVTAEELQPVLEGKTYYTEIFEDPLYGDYLSAFAPIKNASGEVIGILGVDIDAQEVGSITKDVTIAALPIFITTILIIAIIAILTMVIFVSRQLKPLVHIQKAADEIAQGNLQEANTIVAQLPIRKKDEIGLLSGSIQRMIQQLSDIIQQLTASSSKIGKSSDELVATTDALVATNQEIEQNVKAVAAGSENQLHSTEDSARGMEEITMNVQQIAENAFAALDTSQHTLKEAEAGKEAVQRVLNQMNHISTSTEKISQIIEQLVSHSNEIENILMMISEIAEQTNLLALNAAIEAARAGEHGKGFAVVSDEIRKLADESKASTEKIASLIQMINHDTEEAIKAMQAGKAEAEEGSEMVANMQNAFEAILANIARVTAQIKDVSSSTNQITAETEEINSNIDGLADIAKETSDKTNIVVANTTEQIHTMNEIANAANDLKQISNQLEEIIERFRL